MISFWKSNEIERSYGKSNNFAEFAPIQNGGEKPLKGLLPYTICFNCLNSYIIKSCPFDEVWVYLRNNNFNLSLN